MSDGRSRWTHSLCRSCWNYLYPERQSHGLKEPERERCCRCSDWTTSGIYVRGDPDDFEYCAH